MKKLFQFLHIATATLVMFTMTSCSNSGSDSSDDKYQINEDNISASLSGNVPATLITVSEDAGLFSLNVSIGSSGEVSDFGNYILAVKDAFESEFQAEARGNFVVSLAIQGSPPSLIRYSSDDYSEFDGGLSGLLSDNRSGEVVFSTISSLDELEDHFPLVSVYAEKHGYEE